MNFEEAERKFKQLRGQFEAGTLTEAEFKKQLEDLMVEDKQGNWWMIGYKSELWYRYNGKDWIQTNPPHGSLTSSTSSRTDEGRGFGSQRSSKPTRPVLIWSIVGIVGCLFLLTSIWGVSSFLSTFSNTETPTPTVSATPTTTRLPPTPTQTPTPAPTSISRSFSKTDFSFTFGQGGVNPSCIVVKPGTVFSTSDFEEDKWLYFSTKYSDDEIGNSFYWSVLEPDGSTSYKQSKRVLEETENSCFWQGFSLTNSPTKGVYELILEYDSEIIYRLTFSVE